MERTPPFALEDWIVEPEFHLLTHGNTSCRIEPKVMSVLLLLAAHPQRVVSKEEILKAVWPNTFVGEDALTRCISVLRRVLKDDPHNPRFIKTISKVGYCLVATARPLEPPTADPLISVQTQSRWDSLPRTVSVAEAEAATQPLDRTRERTPAARTWAIRIAAAALALAPLGALAVWAIRIKPPPSPIRTFQLTTSAGEQSRPALSPDGKRVAFVWAKQDEPRQHIYVKEVGSESLLRLTDLAGDEFSPVWSPDGQRLAFLSSSDAGLALCVASLSTPASVHKVYIPGETTRWEQGALAWSGDGKSFVLADHIGAQPSSSLFRIDLETLGTQTLTTPPSGWEGDLSPVYSPAGDKIAFLRASESAVADIYWIPAAGGPPHQVTRDGKMINGIAWSSDNRSIIFSSNRAGEYALYKVSLDGGIPRRMPIGTEDATQPAVPPNGSALAFVESSAVFGILQLSAANAQTRPAKESIIVSSTAQDSAPSISPDGTQFAFQSWRSGSQQIWISSIDGQILRQLTPPSADLSGFGSPAWSPAGDQILFDSRISGHSHIFVMPVAGGSMKQITFGEVNDIVPRWSADHRSIYFRSNRGGRWQLWKLPAAGGMPQPVTRDDGMVGQESPDGQWLYFARGGENGIWRMPVAGGEAIRILDQPLAGYWAYWTVSREGIYFLDQTQSTPSISIYDPATQKVAPFAPLERLPPLYSGLSLFHDGHDLLISDKRDAGSHISMAQGVF